MGPGTRDPQPLGVEAESGSDPQPAPSGRARAVGKRVGGYTYVHRDAVPLLSPSDRAAVEAATTILSGYEWNVAKVGKDGVSLLLYEDFDANAFPALLTSVRLEAGASQPRVIDYRKRANPPVLHRKELLLPPDDPRVPMFAALTAAAERHGLLRDSRSIGTRQAWERRIAEAGLRLEGHAFAPCAQGAREDTRAQWEIPRHKTAIARRELSQTVALMLRFGLVRPGGTMMDYGCGLGDDVAALSTAGYDAVGWDPYHRPDGPRRVSDAVNVGFVINVIEAPHERRAVLEAAWKLARRVLVVSVMPSGKTDVTGMRPFRDGVLTSWGTFQRYYGQDDLRALVQEATGETPVSLAPGIVAAFRDKELEQEAAYRRRSRAVRIAEDVVARPRPPRKPARPRRHRPDPRERLAAEIESIWRRSLELGRIPTAGELDEATREALSRKRVSLNRAVALTTSSDLWDEDAMSRAAAARKEDLLVHFALTLFPGAPRYASLPAEIRRDVKAFFGSHAAMLAEARGLLFSLGQPRTLAQAIETAEAAGLAGSIGAGLAFRPSDLPRLPLPVRLVAGCAEVLLGDAISADFARLEADRPRLVFVRASDPESLFPSVSAEIVVDLATRSVRRREGGDTVVYLKSRYLPTDDPLHARQRQVDGKLLAAGIVGEDARGPRRAEFYQLIRAHNERNGPALG